MSLRTHSALLRASAFLKLIVVFVLSASVAPSRADTTLVPAGATWRYLDNGSNQGTTWRAPSFIDTGWASGRAELGYGDGGEATVVSFGPNSSAKYITTYFRHTFTVADPAAYGSLRLRLMRDDGAVLYLNGVEILRSNMPTGTVSYSTLAGPAVGGTDESTFFQSTLSSANLVAGTNVLAVEVHQSNGTSSDLSFDLELIGATANPTATVTRGPYLQNARSTALTVRWRTDLARNSTVRYGTTAANLDQRVDDAVSTTEHQVTLSGLLPDTQYYYSIGDSSGAFLSGSEYTFFTPPPVGTVQPTRIWVLGDSGTANANAAAVRDAYINYNGARYTDLWLMLGDNAYNNGTDTEFQAAVFNMYPSILRQTPLWSTLGNHEYYTANGAPYFDIFTFPTQGEAGGASSGTEKYYAFDYGNIHFICLDSMSSDRSATGPMATWLQNDLELTTQQWIVAFWHHPPYTKGSHDSDNSAGGDLELVQMRQNLLPLLEAGGVDLILGGHSHSYERSYLINGHYGYSSTFTAAMKLNGGDGNETGGGAYAKPGGLAANQGAVYAVAGSSGKATNWWGGSTADRNPTPHPVMYVSLLRLGSLVIDVNGDRMDVKFLRSTGTLDDSFTILKSVANPPPVVSITSPVEGASFTAPATLEITAETSDSNGSVRQVDFYAGANRIGSDTTPTLNGATAIFSVTWSDAAPGSYALTASATDDLGATTTSAPVNIVVNAPPPPAPPANLTATGGDAQVSLMWNASTGATGYNVKRATVSGGAYAQIAGPIAGTSFTDGTAINGTAYFYVVTATNAGGESAASQEANATPRPPAPAAPAGLTAVGGDAQVSLAWNATSGATSYNVKRGSSRGGPFTSIATQITTTSFNDVTAINGTTYFYVVSAVNLGGESADSIEASATPAAPANPPPAPAGLVANAGNAQVSLTWTGSGATAGYSVKRANTAGGPYTELTTGLAGTNYTDATATNGTTYFYVVTASNSAGESAFSNEATATPTAPPTLPASPTNLNATAVSRNRINLTWNDNASNESGYRVERSTNGSTFTQISGSVSANATSYGDTNVAANKRYYYRVRAFNSVGLSAYSNTANTRTPK